MGAGAREAELPSCRSAITCPPLPGHPGTSAKNCDRRIFLKMNGMDFDLRGEARKPSRTFPISWEKLANHRVHLRSPGRSSQTIACICDLLGEGRKRSGAFVISWEKLANHRLHLRSPERSSRTTACICDLLGGSRKPSR